MRDEISVLFPLLTHHYLPSTQATPGFEQIILQYVETSTDIYSSPSESSDDSRDNLHYVPETPVNPDNPFDCQSLNHCLAVRREFCLFEDKDN